MTRNNVFYVNFLQDSHFALHISQSLIYNASTKLNPHVHSAFFILMTCNFSGCLWSHILGWNGRKWRLGSKYWFLIHRAPAQAPKMCFYQQEPHCTRYIFILWTLYFPSILTPKEIVSHNGWWGKIGVLEPGNDGATINKHKGASWSFYLLSHIHTINHHS